MYQAVLNRISFLNMSYGQIMRLSWYLIGMPLVSSMTYNYDPASEYGPSNWRLNEESQTCGGHQQSPININTSSVIYGINQHLHWPDAGPMTGYFVNDGHAPTFYVEKPKILMRVVPYHGQDDFILEQFHLHFAQDHGNGSEHTINGHYASGEIHIVLYNAKYGTFDDALTFMGGVTVIAVLVNSGFGPLVREELSNFFLNNGKTTIETGTDVYAQLSSIQTVLPSSRDFYLYQGSLTTPPCSEVVTWIVMRYPITVHDMVFSQALRLMLQSETQTIARHGNYRPLQPLNNRLVYANFKPRNGELNCSLCRLLSRLQTRTKS